MKKRTSTLNQYEKIYSDGQQNSEIMNTLLDFSERAGSRLGKELPSLIDFFLFLFQPHLLSVDIQALTGTGISFSLSDHYGNANAVFREYYSINKSQAHVYIRSVLLITLIISAIPVFIGSSLGIINNGIWILFAGIALTIFLETVFGQFRSSILHAFNFIEVSPPVFMGCLLISAIITYRLPSTAIIAVALGAAATLVSLILMQQWIYNEWALVTLGLFAGWAWNSAAICSGGILSWKPNLFNFFLLPFILAQVFAWTYIVFGKTFGQFMYAKVSWANQIVPSFSEEWVFFGYFIGYFRTLDFFVINTYQFILYQIEKYSKKVTIQWSPERFYDVHSLNFWLVPHLVIAYKKAPDLARQVLKSTLMIPRLAWARIATMKKIMPDVFVSFSSKDRQEARKLASLLKDEGLIIWYDEEELILGKNDWQDEIQNAIQYSRTAIVLVGKEGLGRYQEQELAICLHEHQERKLLIIPIFLPGTETLDERLTKFTFLDMRNESISFLFESYTIGRLKLGITGRRMG
jgi:hypothetical protein